jgi:SNF2 family DNA or RNA helicase
MLLKLDILTGYRKAEKLEVQIYNKNQLIVGCNDKVLLEQMQATMDGRKVRNVNKIIIPNKSSTKLNYFTDYKIECSDEVRSIIRLVELNIQKRKEVIQKIKSQYNSEDIKFDYEYRGCYSVMKHQKIIFNMIVYPDASAILADTGTCKTGPYLWAIDKKIQLKKIKRAIIITLSNLKKNVFEEMKIQVPNLKGVILSNKSKSDSIINKKYKDNKKNVDYDIYIANYESMNSLIEIIPKEFFNMVILDEAHRIGSPSSHQTRAIVDFFESCKYKYIITATLTANNLMSFFMPYRFLGPDTVPFAKYSEFRGNFMHPVDINQYIWVPNKGSVDKVSKIIGDLAVRFKKEECIDLPELIYETYSCSMGTEQERIYNELKKELIVTINNMCKSCTCKNNCNNSCENSLIAKNALVLLRKLQQISFGFYINTHIEIDSNGKKIEKRNIIKIKENPKLELLVQILNNINKDCKVIIWCNYTYGIEIIVEKLSQAFGLEKLLTCYQDQDVYDTIQKFKNNQYRFLIANQKKMGAGHNIQFSNYSVFVTNSYSYIERDQAEGRQYRQGQKNNVTVIDLIVSETIDEIILKAIKNKIDLSFTLSKWANIL